jgi:CRP-like cAMP-binding protein
MSLLKACIQKQISIPSEELEDIANYFTPLDLTEGEFLLREGQYCKQLVFIQHGWLRLFHTIDGQEITHWISSAPGFITAVTSFIFNKPSRWNIQALTSAKLLVIQRADHFSLLDKYPKWLEFDNLALARAFALQEERMFSHLHMTAEERYLKLLEENPAIFNQVQLQHIASMLGIKPETLSRLRKKIAHSNHS